MFLGLPAHHVRIREDMVLLLVRREAKESPVMDDGSPVFLSSGVCPVENEVALCRIFNCRYHCARSVMSQLKKLSI